MSLGISVIIQLDHLQIEAPGLNLREAIKWLNLSYVSWFNRKTGRKSTDDTETRDAN